MSSYVYEDIYAYFKNFNKTYTKHLLKAKSYAKHSIHNISFNCASKSTK